MLVAYWISPKGEIIDVRRKHITDVINNPEKFGFTDEFIDYVYDFYNEKRGQEGKAREQLMIALFNQGWIRIRKYKNFWSVNVKKFSGKARNFVAHWANKVLKGLFGYKEDDPYIPVKIDQDKKPIQSVELIKLKNTTGLVGENNLIEMTIEEMDNVLPLYEVMKEMGYVKRLKFKDYF